MLAPEKAQCDTCPRRDSKPEKLSIKEMNRPWQIKVDPSVDIDGKPGVIFEFGGSKWQQKELPDEVLRALDAISGGIEISRVVVVTLMK